MWARPAAPDPALPGTPPGDAPLGGAAWLRVPDGVIGLAPPGAPLGPRWVAAAKPWPALAEGDEVVVDAEGLRTAAGDLVLATRQALGWLGPLPDPAVVSSADGRATVTGALTGRKPSLLLEAPWQEQVAPALDAIGRLEPLDALKVAARTLGGLGPGLTPAGDDALSGILFAFRALGGPDVEPALVAVARSVRTNDIAAALLEAAATGFHIEPVHDLVMAAAARDARAAARAAAALDEFGSSSGADLAYGLRLTLTRR